MVADWAGATRGSARSGAGCVCWFGAAAEFWERRLTDARRRRRKPKRFEIAGFTGSARLIGLAPFSFCRGGRASGTGQQAGGQRGAHGVTTDSKGSAGVGIVEAPVVGPARRRSGEDRARRPGERSRRRLRSRERRRPHTERRTEPSRRRCRVHRPTGPSGTTATAAARTEASAGVAERRRTRQRPPDCGLGGRRGRHRAQAGVDRRSGVAHRAGVRAAGGRHGYLRA
jgi:hypothetical protein